MFVRSRFGNTVKNEIDSNDFIVEVVKQNIDGSIFTPDKKYSIAGDGASAKFDGGYLLAYKKVLFKSKDGEYIITSKFGFKPTSSNETAHRSSSSSSNGATSGSAMKSSTANNYDASNTKSRSSVANSGGVSMSSNNRGSSSYTNYAK
jgi:hypothetical protein